MNEFKTMGELVQKVFNVNTAEVWEATPKLRFYERTEHFPTGTARIAKVLQQLWYCRTNGKTEWRDVPMEREDVAQ